MSQPTASSEGTCSADSFILQGKCNSHFELQTGFFNTSWFDNADEVDRIADSLQIGRVVVIRNAVANDVALGMRDELRKFSRKEYQLKESHDHSEIDMPSQNLWRGSGVEACTAITNYFSKFTAESSMKVCSRQHHLAGELNAEKAPRVSSFLDFMKSDPMKRLLATLGAACDPSSDCDLSQLPNVPNSKIEEVSHEIFWRQKQDYVGTTRSARPGRLLSATYYLSDDEFHGSKDGGNFIWCTPFKRVSPDFNTLVLFPVSRQSWHVVQPVLRKSPASRGINFFYDMAGGEEALEADKFAQEWVSRDFMHTMSAIERGAQIRVKKD